MGLGGGGSTSKIPAPTKRGPVAVEPNLDRARAEMAISKRRRTLATRRDMIEPTLKTQTLGA